MLVAALLSLPFGYNLPCPDKLLAVDATIEGADDKTNSFWS